MAKSIINLVSSVQKPNATPVLMRRNRFTAAIQTQILKIASYRDGGRRISRTAFWEDSNKNIYFQLSYGKAPLEIEKGKSVLKASGVGSNGWDDLVEQLEQIKVLAVAGGLDDALAACANAVRSNFKAAKDKKAGPKA